MALCYDWVLDISSCNCRCAQIVLKRGICYKQQYWHTRHENINFWRHSNEATGNHTEKRLQLVYNLNKICLSTFLENCFLQHSIYELYYSWHTPTWIKPSSTAMCSYLAFLQQFQTIQHRALSLMEICNNKIWFTTVAAAINILNDINGQIKISFHKTRTLLARNAS